MGAGWRPSTRQGACLPGSGCDDAARGIVSRPNLVRIHPAGLIIDERARSQHVILREEEGTRRLRFETGTAEALALEAALAGRARDRPGPHELFLRAVTALGGLLTRVEVVARTSEGTLRARLLLQAGKERRELDARPSDAVVLALLAGSPLFAEDDLLEDGPAE